MTTMRKPIISEDFNRFPVGVPITTTKHKERKLKKRVGNDYNLTKDWRSLRYLNELVMLLLFYHMTAAAVVFLGQDITFDEVTATIQISDENNNPPVFTRTHFIGGEDAVMFF